MDPCRDMGGHTGNNKLEEGRIFFTSCISGWDLGRGVHLEDGGPYYEGRRGLPGIGLVEALCKTVTGILNQSLTTDIGFHENLRGFMVGQGMGITSLEAKLLQNMMEMREAILYEIFLDNQKSHNALTGTVVWT